MKIKNKITLFALSFMVLSVGAFAQTNYSKLNSSDDVTILPVFVEDLNDNNFDEVLALNEVVVVDFYANWCGPCRRFLPVFEQVAEEMFGSVTFGKINVDSSSLAVKEYQVNTIPTIIIFKDGEEIQRRVGGCDADTLKSFIQSVF